MIPVFEKIEKFLLLKCTQRSPLLLALSGGPDSLCLFYALLAFRERHQISFHIAHVDHAWREESHAEALSLQLLAEKHCVPFHLKVLNPADLKGNLEAVCREERYAFFTDLCVDHSLQALLTGHHLDDQAETILKRLLEGSRCQGLSGLQSDSMMRGCRVLRPLLEIKKKEILDVLKALDIPAFDDPTNHQSQFLRARMRQSIIPELNRQFGKDIRNNLIALGSESLELVDYFDKRCAPYLEKGLRGHLGYCLDLLPFMPIERVELKYLLHVLGREHHFFLSREIIEMMAKSLISGKANQKFEMGRLRIEVDRHRLFILTASKSNNSSLVPLDPGYLTIGDWKGVVEEKIFEADDQATDWKKGWLGSLHCYLPLGRYHIGFLDEAGKNKSNLGMIKKRWSQSKVPAFLYHYFPLITGFSTIEHEFLTGKRTIQIKTGDRCMKVSFKKNDSF